jgi:hypothetical protein
MHEAHAFLEWSTPADDTTSLPAPDALADHAAQVAWSAAERTKLASGWRWAPIGE